MCKNNETVKLKCCGTCLNSITISAGDRICFEGNKAKVDSPIGVAVTVDYKNTPFYMHCEGKKYIEEIVE